MEDFSIVLCIVGGAILVFALLSLVIKERLFISESLIATIIGILLGKYGGFSLTKASIPFNNEFMFEFARMVISIQVVAVGMVVSKKYVFDAKMSLFILLCPLMALSWLIASVLVWLLTDNNWTISFIIGACVTPTDPVLASTILKGKFANRYIPLHIRKLLCFESGANDGLVLPLIRLPLFYMACAKKPTETLKMWFLKAWMFEIGCAILLGALTGFIFRYLLNQSRKYKLIDKESFLVYTIALCCFITGLAGLIKVDDIFACFICGVVFSWYDEETILEVKESDLLEVIDMVLNISFFIYFGMNFPRSYPKIKDLILCVGILLFRRLPLFFIAKPIVGELYNFKEAFFAGWYGPIGVGAIYSLHFVLKSQDLKSLDDFDVLKPKIIDLIYLIVCSSIFVHGITAPIVHFHLKNKIASSRDESYMYEQSEYSETESLGDGKVYEEFELICDQRENLID